MTQEAVTPFIDLEIRIFPREEYGYPVSITLGEQSTFPRGFLPDSVLSWDTSSNIPTDGSQLFEILFSDPVLREAWAECRGRAPQRRIRLCIEEAAPELHPLPWELLQERSTILSASASTPFSRYLPAPQPWGSPVKSHPIRILAILSSPADLDTYNLSPLDLEAEQKNLKAALCEAGTGIQIDFLEPPITLTRLEEALHVSPQQSGYHILHYLGHGEFSKRREQAILYLENDDGNAQKTSDDALINMLARQQICPSLVFLAACESTTRSTTNAFLGLGPKLVTAGVPAVVAMQNKVTMQTARQTSNKFYLHLVEDGVVDVALNAARSSLISAERPDFAVPVLFMRLKSGQLWDVDNYKETLNKASVLLLENESEDAYELVKQIPDKTLYIGYANLLAALALMANKPLNKMHPKDIRKLEQHLKLAQKKMANPVFPKICLAILEIDYYNYHGQVSSNNVSPQDTASELKTQELPEEEKQFLHLLRISQDAKHRLGLLL